MLMESGEGSIFGATYSKEEHKVRSPFNSEYDWEGDAPLDIPYHDTVLYKVHVRGYTKQQKFPQKNKRYFRRA